MAQRKPSPLDDPSAMWLDRLRQAERADPAPKPMGFAKIVRALKKKFDAKKEPRP